MCRRCNPAEQTTQSEVIQNLSVSVTRLKERDFYLLRARKLDMDMPPDSLEAGGVNELSVAVAVDESLTTEQAASGCLDTHRERSSNSNTEFISIICSVTCIGSLCCLC